MHRPMEQQYDVVIVGAGLAGLYAAHRLKRAGSDPSMLLLERSDSLGGRAKTQQFKGVTVATGAGIGRKHKDVRLQKLLRVLQVPFHEFPVVHRGTADCRTKESFMAVKRAFDSAATRPHAAFADFALDILKAERYNSLVRCSGYSDYERADAGDVLYNYGFDDNYDDYVGLSIPWADLIAALAKDIRGHCKIMLNCTVLGMGRSGTTRGLGHRVDTTLGTVWGKAVVLATEIGTVRQLLPLVPVFRHVQAQPFIRVYASFSGSSKAAMQAAVPGLTIVDGPLQKIIPVSGGVFMVAYADNAAALAIHAIGDDKCQMARVVERALRLAPRSLHIDALRAVFIPSGTHFNDPELYMHGRTHERSSNTMPALRNPLPGVYVVGEAVSRHQGWVEGALETVDDMFAPA